MTEASYSGIRRTPSVAAMRDSFPGRSHPVFPSTSSSTSSPAIESRSAFASFALRCEPATHWAKSLCVASPNARR